MDEIKWKNVCQGVLQHHGIKAANNGTKYSRHMPGSRKNDARCPQIRLEPAKEDANIHMVDVDVQFRMEKSCRRIPDDAKTRRIGL